MKRWRCMVCKEETDTNEPCKCLRKAIRERELNTSHKTNGGEK